MTVVADASVVVARLLDDGSVGEWAEQVLGTEMVAGPHILPAETANVLRKAALHRDVSADVASLAHGDLLDMRLDLFPYEPFAERVWDLRGSVATYDGWYVAIAERLNVALATLDRRLARAKGPTCRFITPPR